MPNWCLNVLEVEGESKLVHQFKELVRGEDTDFSLNNLVKMPPKLLSTRAGKDNPNWYDWSIENWGTKWDVVEAEVMEASDTRLTYQFLSAWTPPIKWLERVSKEMPALRFTLFFEEEVHDFCGSTTAE
ncbi:MAG: hypothetical protein KJ069_26010 [Anaerolineae bacterium]|nr:hypothetical protein [Anaerolineae bacterium]